MNITASAKYVRIAPQKVLLIARNVQKKSVPNALTYLSRMNTKGARLVQDVVTSAVANASNNAKLASDQLLVDSIVVGKGIIMKRFRAVSRGMAHKYTKKTSHITVTLKKIAQETKQVPARTKEVSRKNVTEEKGSK